MTDVNYDIIASRRHPGIDEKLDIFSLINQSYIGGKAYLNGNHLFQYQRESTPSYLIRKKRAVYYNYVQPIADMLTGFLFNQEPVRDYTGGEYLIGKASKLKSLNAFMQTLSIQSSLYTCGVLVDAPDFNDAIIQTERDRIDAGIYPYCLLYRPWQIRDFDYDDNYELNWILLDNTNYDSISPFSERTQHKVYALWERNTISNFEISGKDKNSVRLIKKIDNPLGVIPFVFCNWRDIDDDFITETPFEDVAFITRAMFNIYSLIDESLQAGTFKTLFVPVERPDDIPEDIRKCGFGDLPVFPYRASVGSPFFSGVDITNITYYFQAIGEHVSHILAKFGLNPEMERAYMQSGRAKSIEFQKCEALLTLGAENLENTEKKIFKYAGLWEGKEITGSTQYTREFQTEDIGKETERLLELLVLPYETLKKEVTKLLVRKNLSLSNLEPKVLNRIFKEIDESPDESEATGGIKKPDLKNFISNERHARSTGLSGENDSTAA